jgi:hypothetical protein
MHAILGIAEDDGCKSSGSGADVVDEFAAMSLQSDPLIPWAFASLHHSGVDAAAISNQFQLINTPGSCAIRLMSLYSKVLSDNLENLSDDKKANMTLRLLAAARRVILSAELEYVAAVAWMLASMAATSGRLAPLSFFRSHILSAIKVAIQ